jgi:aryl-alcohol dehydrogenase-like predicted oxidoreductase
MHRQDGKLGATGLQASRLGLGLAALGRPGYINLGHGEDLQGEYDPSAMEQRAHAVLDAAWGGGIRYFDTARSYGRGEEFLGSWLIRRGITPETITVGSKWGYTYTAGWQVQAEAHEIKEHSLPVLRRQWSETNSILGKQLDLYQVHSGTLESGILENIDLLNELVRMKSSGLHIGLSITGASQAETLRRAIEITIDGAAVFETVLAPPWRKLTPPGWE